MFQITIVPVLLDVVIFFSSITILTANTFWGCCTITFSGQYGGALTNTGMETVITFCRDPQR